MEVFRCSPIRGFLLDITGVLYNSSPNTLGIAIPGSIDAIDRLYSESRVRFVSNESSESRGELARKLKKLGFNLKEEHIFTPAPVAIQYLKQHALKPHLLVHQGALKEFADMSKGEPNCVVMGDAECDFTYDAMNEAFRVLTALDDPLIITLGFGKFYQRVDGPCLDVGGFAKALQYATDARIVTFGKPAESFFLAAIKDMRLSKDEVVMIGDDIVSDIGGAMKVGIRAVQVRTGKWRYYDSSFLFCSVNKNSIVLVAQ
uniref:Phospholysine phosphohistidine inorganic pyrophosphate phosphatase n=1 Tax=Ascaris lumbricoides TaxID=6252 RepID=A0A0M3HY40_ASCLU